jgi:hypothetical protein
MKNRLLVPFALLFLGAACLSLFHKGDADPASTMGIGELTSPLMSGSPLSGELVLVRTPDEEFLNPASDPAESDASQIDDAESDSGQEDAAVPTAAVAAAATEGGGDAKETLALEVAGPDGKQAKEMIDPKWLPPIADGSEAGGVVGGGVGGFGGGGGGAIPGEVAAFTQTTETEKDGQTVILPGRTTVINRTLIRTVPQTTPVTPVPEAGGALTGIAAGAIAFAALLRRQRAGFRG